MKRFGADITVKLRYTRVSSDSMAFSEQARSVGRTQPAHPVILLRQHDTVNVVALTAKSAWRDGLSNEISFKSPSQDHGYSFKHTTLSNQTQCSSPLGPCRARDRSKGGPPPAWRGGTKAATDGERPSPASAPPAPRAIAKARVTRRLYSHFPVSARLRVETPSSGDFLGPCPPVWRDTAPERPA